MRWVRLALRFVYIGTICLFYALIYAAGRARTLFLPRGERRRAAVSRLRGRLLRRMMTALGATFIKMGQVMSTRPDLLSAEMIDELRQLQDRLPPFPFAKAKAIIEEDLSAGVESLFAELETTPVAAASVAQVHRGRLADGDEVAVKVLRPDVRHKVDRDAVIMMWGARIASWHPKWRLSDPVGHLREFVDGIVKQTDLRLEVRNYERFQQNFRDFDGVFFPRVYPEISAERVMTMEFVRGVKIDQLEPHHDYDDLGARLREMFLKMCFVDGFLHADLHPGNLLVTDDHRVAVFDVGLAKQLSEDLLVQFIDFNRCLSLGDSRDVVNHLKTYHTYMENVDWDALLVDVQRFVDGIRSQKMAEIEFGGVINEIFALGRKYHVRPVTDMTLMLVGVVTAEGIGKMLNPHVNSFEEMGKFLLPILQERGMLRAPAKRPAAEL